MSTVSAVLNNNIQKIRISESTKNKVLAAAKELDYRPNISARKLAKNYFTESLPIICIFWEMDGYHLSMKQFIDGINRYIQDTGRTFEYLICPFEQDHLEEKKRQIFSNLYHGMIFVGLSKQDEKFLQASQVDVPIVLFNREEPFSNSVFIDNYNVGRTAALTLLKHNPVTMAQISIKHSRPHRPESIRAVAFADECENAQIPKEEIIYIAVQDNIAGGYSAAEKLFTRCQFPCGVFVSTPIILKGVMRYIDQNKLRIPEDVMVIAYGQAEAERIFSQSCTITNISLPVALMSYDCLSIIDHLLRHEVNERQLRVYQGILTYGLSCPDAENTKKITDKGDL